MTATLDKLLFTEPFIDALELLSIWQRAPKAKVVARGGGAAGWKGDK